MGGKHIFGRGIAKNLRDMKQDFGFLPYPKLDAEQDGYRTLVHDTVLIGGVSTASANLDSIGAVLEALNAETYRSVTPGGYETALKVKYSRDDMSSKMIDIIHDNIGGSFALAYSSSCSNVFMQASFYTPLIAKKTDFVSNYVKMEKAAQKNVDKMVEAFNAIDQ